MTKMQSSLLGAPDRKTQKERVSLGEVLPNQKETQGAVRAQRTVQLGDERILPQRQTWGVV